MIERLTLKSILVNIIRGIVGIISFFLGLRILFLLMGANPSTPLVEWVYSMSTLLMTPLRGIVPNSALGNGGVLDWVALITLVIYFALGELIISLVHSITPLEEEDRYMEGAETYHSIRHRH